MTARRVASDELLLLKELGKLGALHGHVPISSGALALRLGTSQQTASRRILGLLEKGLIVRRMGTRRQLLTIAPRGADALRAEFAEYRDLFASAPGELTIRGKVVAGLGEGQYYMSRRGYREAFQKLLGFDAHPGTLNLRLPHDELGKLETLRARTGLLVSEFVDEGRTFGAVNCFPSRIEGVACAVVLPVRSHHSDILEVISRERLRDALGIRDGDEVSVVVPAKGG